MIKYEKASKLVCIAFVHHLEGILTEEKQKTTSDKILLSLSVRCTFKFYQSKLMCQSCFSEADA